MGCDCGNSNVSTSGTIGGTGSGSLDNGGSMLSSVTKTFCLKCLLFWLVVGASVILVIRHERGE